MVVLLGSVYFFKDRIVQQFIAEANKALNTPVKIGQVEVSLLADFPNLAIVFKDVYIEDSHPDKFPLFTAKSVSFFINPWDAWNGNYAVRGLQVVDSETNLKINAKGKSNYIILKPQDGNEREKNFVLKLKNVVVKNAVVHYTDLQTKHDHTFSTEYLVTSLLLSGEQYTIQSRGDVTTQKIGIRGVRYLEEKQFQIKSNIFYNDELKKVKIDSSVVSLGSSEFVVDGEYFFKDRSFINLTALGKQTTIKTLLSLMPEHVNQALKGYESDGDVYFNLQLKGEFADNRSPLFSINFGCRNTTLTYKPTQTRIEHANLEGSYATASGGGASVLSLKNVNGQLNGHSFQSNVFVEGFSNPYVRFDFNGKIDAASIADFYPLPQVKGLSGVINANVQLAGEINLLKNKSTAQQVKTNGTIAMTGVAFEYGQRSAKFLEVDGTLEFNNNDIKLSQVSGKIGKSDFLLNGVFKNAVTFLLFDDQPIGIDTELKSKYLDIEQLLFLGFGEQNSSDYRFSISPNVHLNFNCDIGALSYRRFQPKKVRGDLLVKNQMAVSRNISFEAMGGNMTLNGILDAQHANAIDLVTACNLQGVNADSLFYVFEDFRQSFVQAHHLKGELFAEATAEMTFSEKLVVAPESITADVSATIKKGELNNFEPLQALKKYIDDDGLGKLRFADLTNEIHIENKTVYIPMMEIKSNVTTIQLSGKHTFDQKIDYRVIAPLNNRKKIDADEAFGAIEETGGKAKLFLKITGTTDDYDISYDTEAVKKKIANDLKKEVLELKNAFKTKGSKKKKELELQKDDYFDWDNQ